MRDPFAPYVPRLLDEPWERARVIAGSIAFCDITGFTALTERLSKAGKEGSEKISDAINGAFVDLIHAAEDQGGDVLSFEGDAMAVLFTGDGRHGRAINAVHAMQEALEARPKVKVKGPDVRLSMSAGIATGPVHVIIAGTDPKALVTVGPTLTRALLLESRASAGETRAETVDASAIETKGTTVPLFTSAFLDPAVREVVESGTARPEHRPAVVGFAMLSGVDRVLQRNPAIAVQRISDAIEIIDRAAAEFQITVLGTDVSRDGARVILAAGVPTATDSGEERMIRAAKAALDADPPFGLRFGIATGHVFAGDLGGPTRRTYTVMGSTVNLAARLAATAAPGQVFTTHRAIDRTTTRYAISEDAPATFKGIDHEVTPVMVGGEQVAQQPDVSGGFVGRSEPRALLIEHIRGLDRGRGGVVDVVGAAGIGKSRLVVEALRDFDVTTLLVRCEEYRQSIAYGAASKLLRAAMGIDDREDPQRVGVLLKAQVRDLTPYLEPWLPLIAEIVGAEVDPTPEVDGLDPKFRRDRALWAASQLAVWLTRQPIVVRIEGSQWMDAASAELLDYVLTRGADLPWLVVGTRRPTGTGWIPDPALDPVTIELGPLSPGASRALLTELRRDDPVLPDVAGAVIERSGGNPLFLEQLAVRAGASDELPDTVESTVSMHIDQLSPDDRKVLREASVLGRRFSEELAEAVIGSQDWSVLDEYVEREWDGLLRFRHTLVREAAYEGLPYRTRRDLHLRTARALEGTAGPEILSLHYARAEEDEKAWRYGVEAGRDAFARNAPDDASVLLERALDAAGKVRSVPAADIAAAAELLGDAHDLAGRPTEADEAYRAARGKSKLSNDKARLDRKRGLMREREGKYPAALRMLTTGLKALPKTKYPEERAELEVAYAGVKFRQGKYRDAVARAEKAIPLAEKAGADSTLGHAYYLRGHARHFLDHTSGDDELMKALAIFEASKDHLMQANVLNNLGVHAYDSGRWDEALDYQRRNAEQRELAGDVVGAAVAAYNRALVLMDQGKLDEAESALEQVRVTCRAANFPVGVAGAAMNLANVSARRGDSESALAMLEETMSQFENMGADSFVVVNRLAEAEAHLLGGDVEAALAVADKAIEAAEGLEGAEVPLVGLYRVRGVSLVWLGRGQEGHIQLMDALAAAREHQVTFEEALISDGLATLYGEVEAADRRDEIVSRLGIVRLPPYLTPG